MSLCAFCLLLLLASVSLPTHALPAGSRLYPLPDGALHVRLLQPPHLQQVAQTDVAVLLISGPNENFHADSAWYALWQPLLAQHYRTFLVDRRSSGFSSDTTAPSYRAFAKDLALLLPQLPARQFLLVSFASGSISARLLAEQPAMQPRLAGLVLIDPDIPLPEALALYNGYPADWYRANLAELLSALEKGVWNERTAKKLTAEQQHIEQLVPKELQPVFDRDYLQQVFQTRQRLERQQARAREIAAYQADLAAYTQTPWQQSAVPVSVVDSAFETPQIAADEKQAPVLRRWQQQGSDWSRQLCAQSGGVYLPLASTEHLLMFSETDALTSLVKQLLPTQPLPQGKPAR